LDGANADIAWERTSSRKRKTAAASVRLCVGGKFWRNKSCGEPDDDAPLDEYSKGIAQFVVLFVSKKIDELRCEQCNAVARLKKELRTLRQEVEVDREHGVEVYCRNLERRIAELAAENIEMKALLGATLTRLGQKSGNMPTGIKSESGVIELPDWRKRHA
jgi:hypothetical protein